MIWALEFLGRTCSGWHINRARGFLGFVSIRVCTRDFQVFERRVYLLVPTSDLINGVWATFWFVLLEIWASGLYNSSGVGSGDFQSGCLMDAFENLTESLLYEDCNMKLDGSYQQDQFVRKTFFVAKCENKAECENNKPSSTPKHMLVNDVPKCTDDHLEESLIAQNKREDGGMLYSDTEGSAMEDLSQAVETELSIHGAEKQDCNEIQIKMADEDEHEKTEQNKISLCMQESLMGKTLFKSPKFLCSGLFFPSSMNLTNGMAAKADKCSFKLISAIRGSHEQNGLGPRPKLCVKWAPDVREPRHSSVSHTVKSHSRYRSKKDHKHKQKGKSHTNGSNKKHHSKRRDNSEGVHSRLQSSSVYGNRILLDVSTPKGSVWISENSHMRALEASIFSTQMVRIGSPLNFTSKHSEQCRRDGKHGFVATTSSDI